MRLYEVGGAVRDALLGLPATDHDWVAVGASPETLAALGYQPVGRDFPVFLHPQTHQEVALARTERKTAPGYHGFVFHADTTVTLEEDLVRRDLTINAMARDEQGTLIDPFGGEKDLRAGVLRHVSVAFVEDPVRLLRVARFAARFAHFHVAPETAALLRQMVDAGEVDALVPERVWQELARGLMEATPSRMCQVLQDSGAMARLLPELSAADLARRAQVLDAAAAAATPLTVRFACLARPAADPAAMAQRLRAPKDCEALAQLLARELTALTQTATPDASASVQLLERCDAWRRPQRFGELLLAAELECPGQINTAHWRHALALTSNVDTAAAAAKAAADGARGPAIGAAVQAARVQAVAAQAGR